MTKLCEYGCEQEALYFSKTGKGRCASHYKKCPVMKEQMKKHMLNVHKNNSDMGEKISIGLKNSNKTEQMRSGWYKSMYIDPSNEELLDRNRRNSETNKKAGHRERNIKKWADWKITGKDKEIIKNMSAWQNDKNKKYRATSKMMKTMEKRNIKPGRANAKKYKEFDLYYQGKNELVFLTDLEEKYGKEWFNKNVKRGPTFEYYFQGKRRYQSDFLINDTIYEIKSRWYWDNNGTNQVLKEQNLAKLKSASQDFEVILVLDNVETTIPHI